MLLNQLTLYVENVHEASSFFETLLQVEADFSDDNFAQLTIADYILMLTKVKIGETSRLTIHLEVKTLEKEFERLKTLGISIIKDPYITDWGTYSMLVQGPDDIIIDLYQLKG